MGVGDECRNEVRSSNPTALIACWHGTVIPFPLSHRRSLVRAHARHLSGQRPEVAQRTLDRQLNIQREALARRGVDPLIVEREIAELHDAIRAELCRTSLMDCRR